ncbi:MAG: hypothetical protein ACYC1P_05305 [Gaiellaceae bacterium]
MEAGTMEKSDRRLLEQVEEARRRNPGLAEQLTRYRKDRQTYERIVRGRDAATTPASSPAADGGSRRSSTRVDSGRGRIA